MPTIIENLKMWDELHPWQEGGDEWSAPWGNAERQWQITVYPRISQHLENRCLLYGGFRILEIGPGMGRWTQRLLRHDVSVCAVDISKKAIEGLETRVQRRLPLGETWRLTTHLGTGTDLPASDGSVDFVFSFDSLVHVDQDTLDAYIKECARVLKPQTGVGFIHHANKESSKHWRGKATAYDVCSTMGRVGLRCYVQELSRWVHEQDLGLTDCFTTFGKTDRCSGPTIVTSDILDEADRAKRLAYLYDWRGTR